MFKLILAILIVLCILFVNTNTCNCDEQYNDYSYAYNSGDLVAGTVYASDPEDNPGLGWVL